MITRKLVLFLFVVLVTPRLVSAQAAGFTSANFLKIGMGARAAAMADSFTAISDDATAVYWNPAGLVQAQGTQISLTHSQWLQGVNIDFAALSQNLGSAGAIGLGFTTLSLQPFSSTLEDSTGNFAGFGPQVSAGDWELIGGYSNVLSRFIPGRFLDNTLVGIAVNVIGQNENGPTGTAFSFTGGLIQLFPKEHFSLGLELVNLGTAIQDRSEPLDFKLGLAWYHLHNLNQDDKLTLSGDLDLDSDTGFLPSLGSEYRLPLDRSDVGFLRAGLRTTDEQYGLSFIALGAGLEHDFSNFVAQLDYAYVPYGTLGPTHRITLSLKLGQEKNIKGEITGPDHFNLDSPGAKLTLKAHADDPVAEWTLSIRDEKDEVIRKVSGKGEPPENYLWDGKSDDGKIVKSGLYTAVLQVKDINNRENTTGPVTMKAIAPLSLDNIQWTLSSDSVFAIAQADILPASQGKLKKLAAELLEYFDNVGIEVQGHTDSSPCHIGPHCKFANNQQLSEARAQAVKDLFVQQGLKVDNVVVSGKADAVPVADNSTVEGRSKNRRITVRLKSTRVETPETITKAATFLMHNGEVDEALDLFKVVSDHTPDKPQPYRSIAECYRLLGNELEAQKADATADKLEGKTTPKLTPVLMLTPVPTMMPTSVPTVKPTPAGTPSETSVKPTTTATSVPVPASGYQGSSWSSLGQ